MAISLDDAVKVRDLETKYNLELTDTVVIEDNDGTKTTPVSSFKSVISAGLFYNTVEDMKAASFREGEIVYTLGYHSPNDGGGAMYVIKYDPAAMEDNALIHYLYTSDTLRAELVLNDLSSINVLQFGVYGDGSHDDTIAFNNAIKSGYQLYIPKREYKLGNPLMPISNSILDFNGSTLISSSIQPAVSIGLNSERTNIVICNVTIKCQYGITLYQDAANIEIKNITILPTDSRDTSVGIRCGSSNNINIHDIAIGKSSATGETSVLYGITWETQTNASQIIGLNIHSCAIYTTQCGIEVTSNKNAGVINISDCLFKGKLKDAKIGKSYGIGILSDSIVNISNCSFTDFNTAIAIAGPSIKTDLSSTNVIITNSERAYTLQSNTSTLSLFGIQRYTGIGSRSEIIIFGSINGKLYINTDIICPNSSIYWVENDHSTGEIIDSANMSHIWITCDESSLNVNALLLPTIRHTTIQYTGTKNISAIAKGIKGQIITLRSDKSINILNSNSIILKNGSSFTLDSSNSITLRNTGSKWVQI